MHLCQESRGGPAGGNTVPTFIPLVCHFRAARAATVFAAWSSLQQRRVPVSRNVRVPGVKEFLWGALCSRLLVPDGHGVRCFCLAAGEEKSWEPRCKTPLTQDESCSVLGQAELDNMVLEWRFLPAGRSPSGLRAESHKQSWLAGVGLYVRGVLPHRF